MSETSKTSNTSKTKNANKSKNQKTAAEVTSSAKASGKSRSAAVKSNAKQRRNKEINQAAGTVIRTSLRIILGALIIMVIVTLSRAAYQFSYNIFNGTAASPYDKTEVVYMVEEGDSIQTIAEELKLMGLIKDTNTMVMQKVIFSYTIYPGEAKLSASMTSREILERLSVVREMETTSDQEGE